MIVKLALDEKREEKLGNKGKFLLQMKKEGFNVPGGFILDTDVYDEVMAANSIDLTVCNQLKKLNKDNVKEISEAVNELLDKVKIPADISSQIEKLSDGDKLYAVRSSGNMEDLEEYSFAGQYDTFLNVKKEEIGEKIIACYRSMFGEVLLQYVANNGIDAPSMKMSVVVQEMVDATLSGICFTIDPVNGFDKEMLIEVSEGLGENIVSGKTAPEQYFYDWYDKKEVRRNKDNKFLNEETVEKYAGVFSDIQHFFGYPCDIEFAIADEKLYILQARRITKIGYNGITDMWTTADFKDGGVSATVCTPYMWSLYEYIWEFALRSFIVKSEILKDEELPKKLGEMFYGRPYWNMSAVKKAMSQVIGYKEREFDNEYGIIGDYEGDGQTTKITPSSVSRMIRIVIKQSKILKGRRENNQRYKDELLDQYYKYKEKYDAGKIENIEKDFYNITKKTYLRSETTYFWQIFINTIHQSLYKDSLLKYVTESEYLSLLGNIDNISHLLPFYEMWDATRQIRKDEKAFSYWKEKSTQVIAKELSSKENFMPAVKDIIDKYGYHSDKELDITYPCYYEEPETVIQMVKDMVILEDSYSPLEDKENGHKMYLEVFEKVKGKVSERTFRKVEKKVSGMRKMLWWREEFRDVSTRFYYMLRVYTMEYAKHLVQKGVLKDAGDVWFLKVGDLWDYIDGNNTGDDLREIIGKNRYYYDCYRNYISDNEIGTVFSRHRDDAKIKDSSIKGLGANNGCVTATARVIEDFTQIDRLQEGDILVTRFTDTGWTPKFAILSGIVTEYGGILCHAAIVSREYGIPAIVCCKDAMQKIRDGQTVTIDGSTGTVTIVK
ncbi:MAG: phosphoenolpyruvate synthase [Lachnospiraceae bacterium]|nr:phosphoenolpyruvate synthase [Lachnospiraceae bacterium]